MMPKFEHLQELRMAATTARDEECRHDYPGKDAVLKSCDLAIEWADKQLNEYGYDRNKIISEKD